MKILHVTPSYLPAYQFGGPIKSVHLLNKYLVKNGVEVNVITTNAGLDSTIYKPNKWHNIDNVKVMYFNFFGYIHYNFSISLFIYLINNVKNFDVIHITAVWNFPVIAASTACWLSNKKYIISPRGTIYKETIELKSSYFKKIYYFLFAKFSLQNAEYIHFTTNDESEKVLSYLKLKAKPLVIPNGIELVDNQIIITKNNSEKYFLFLGRLSKKKGIDILLDSFAEFKKNNKSHKLYIVGPDEENYKLHLEHQIQILGLESEIIFKSLTQGEEKNLLYKNAEAFVLTSYSENFGMTVVEAIQNNCAVIISDKVGIYKDLEKYNASIVCKLDKISIKNALEKMTINDESKLEMIKNANTCINELYEINAISKKFIKIYNDILN